MRRSVARAAHAALAAGALVALAGCGDGTAGGPAVTTEATTEATMTEPSTPSPSGPAPGPTGPGGGATGGGATGAAVEDAVRDLAGRLGVPVEDVRVVRDVAVTWRSSALGCPKPGMAYTQALTEGRLLELEAGGRTYSYHSGRSRGPFLCERPEAPYSTAG